MSYRFRNHLAGAAVGLTLLVASPGLAQLTGIVNYWNPATGTWDQPGNWSLGSVPDANSQDFAVVGGVSGVSGISTATATINTAVATNPGGITLGAAAGNSGTLQIPSGGSITVVDTPFDGNGNVYVGNAGTGTLTIDRGGSLTAVAVNEGGSATSLMRLGATSGSGTASITVDDANLARITRIIGPNVDFNTARANFGGGTLIAQLTSATHSPIKATDNAGLGGTLTFEMDPSINPTVGSTWDIVNARQVSGVFDTVNLPATPLPVGQIYNVRTVNGGLGKIVQLAVEERLVLNVNRSTGAVSISNPGTTAISIDGYSIGSTTLGELNPANFTPLGGTWQVANATANHVSQLNPTAVPTFATGSTTSLGNIFTPPVPVSFGTTTEDLTFEYTDPNNSVRTGVVNYVGTANVNNLVLRIDPVSGAAQLRNTSPFTVNIDNYSIGSALGSLDVGQWSSLDDQNAAGGDWQEANVSANRLSELKFTGFTALASGAFFDLGNPFNETLGKRDLTFQFVLNGENTLRNGVVVYETISAALDGDYNGNGVVDAADYVLWRKSPSSYGGAGGYATWRANFGKTGGSGLVASPSVPEPTSVTMLTLALSLIGAGRGRSLTARRRY